MLVNLRGRVKNVKLTPHHWLHPLFEAVVNSIHAIEEARRPGRIDVIIRRDLSQTALDLGDYSTEPITGFEIVDNGIGFTDQNFQSFSTSDSMYKADRGGKGIGRLLWLKAFHGAEITSHYEQDAQWRTRSFRFTLDGVRRQRAAAVSDENSVPQTIVRLHGLLGDYGDRGPKAAEAIAKRIIEHCFEYFLLNTVPPVFVHDDRDNEIHDLKRIFDDDIQPNAKTETFVIQDKEFRVTHLLVGTSYESQHRLHYCADKRTVLTEQLTGRIPDLPHTLRLESDKRSCVYAGYVAGAFLDDAVTQERTSFEIPNDEYTAVLPSHIPWSESSDAAVARAQAFLTPHTDPIKLAKEEQVHNYVRSQAPQYRALVKHRPEIIDKIPPNLSTDKLDLELYKHDQSYKAQLRAKGQ